MVERNWLPGLFIGESEISADINLLSHHKMPPEMSCLFDESEGELSARRPVLFDWEIAGEVEMLLGRKSLWNFEKHLYDFEFIHRPPFVQGL
jgi:hypothetical protein